MRISRSNLAFMAILGAGLLLVASTVVLPSASTFGQETDEPASSVDASGFGQQNGPGAPAGPGSGSAPVAQAPVGQPGGAPLPPAAPVESDGTGGPSAGTGPAIQLPSAGNGGYLSSGQGNGMTYALLAFGAALMGSGSLVWAYSRRQR